MSTQSSLPPSSLPSLLVLDDTDAFVSQLRTLFKNEFNVLNAVTARDARVLIRKHQPTHLIMNLAGGIENAGDASGLPLIAEFKEMAKKFSVDLSVFVMSHYLSVATTTVAMKKGADGCVVLPAPGFQVKQMVLDAEPDFEVPKTGLSLGRLEWELIQFTRVRCDGKISTTAAILDMHRRTIQRKLNKHPAKERPQFLPEWS